MAFFRVQVTFEGVSGVPSGRYVNDWCFEGPADPTNGEWTTLFEELQKFYDDVDGAQTFPMLYYMSEEIATTGHEMRAYELETPPPHIPLAVYSFGMTVDDTITALPAEVACVLSFHGDVVAGTDVGPGPHLKARHRNRVFLGPLNINSLEIIGGDTPRPRTVFMSNMMYAAGGLLNNATLIAAGWNWAIWSPTRADGEHVRGGHVDNAFDTQRRRGAAATLKQYFGLNP